MLGFATISFVFSVLWISGAFALARRWNNTAIIDPFWSGGFILLALLAWWIANHFDPRHAAILIFIVAWSVRLTFYLSRRFTVSFPHEDARYAVYRSRWKIRFWSKMYALYLFQGAVLWLMSFSFYAAFRDDSSSLSYSDYLGMGLISIGIVGEALADRQLQQFREHPNNSNRVCEVGLWAYSRHPNYFFECITWLGIACFGGFTAAGFYAWSAPLIMLWLICFVSGIPPLEAQSLLKRGRAYQQYQRQTSPLIPWLRKKI